MTDKTIKCAILLDSADVPAWQYHLVQQILKSDDASVDLLILGDSVKVAEQAPQPGQLYRRFEENEKSRDNFFPSALETRNVADLLSGIDQAQLPARMNGAQSFQASKTFEQISDHNLDVILALGGIHLIDFLCPVSRCGVWYLWHDYGQTACADGSGIGFWEVLKNRPHVHSELVIRQKGAPNDVVAYESFSGIHRKSHFRSRHEHLWKVAYFFPRVLRNLAAAGAGHFFEKLPHKQHNAVISAEAFKWRMTNANLFLPLVAYFLWRLWRKLTQQRYFERWLLLYDISGTSRDFSQFAAIAAPEGRFWADPHIVAHDDKYFVFIEEADIRSRRGHISVMQMDRDGSYTAPTKIIEKPYHLSYPFVFEWNEEHYLIPESAANHSIEIYRCESFPYDWKLSHNLMDNVSAYDTTLFEHDGIWWMFTNIRQHEGASGWDELFLFYARSPVDREWQPHPMNPIVSDVRRARPAGRIYVENGQLYRPSQNSSYRYGYGLSFNKITKLNTTSYAEQVVRTVEPNWDRRVRALHSFSRADSLVMIDAIYRSRTGRRDWDT